MENNFKNGSSETENNKELQAECEDPPYTKHLMNSKLRKWFTLHEKGDALPDFFMAWTLLRFLYIELLGPIR